MIKSVKTTTNQGIGPAQDMHAEGLRLLQRLAKGSGCEDAVLRDFVQRGRIKRVNKGEYVCRMGTPVTQVSMLIEGVLEIARIQPDGHRHLVGIAFPGDFISLAGMIDGLGHLHDVAGRTAAVLLTFSADQFKSAREKNPCLILMCERLVVRRMRLVYDRLAADPAWPLENRVAHMLLMCSELFSQSPAGAPKELALSQTDMADWLGISRQRINFALKQIETSGAVRLEYGKVVLIDPQVLHAMADS